MSLMQEDKPIAGPCFCRIPRSLDRGRMEFCERHQRWYRFSCLGCDQEYLDGKFREDNDAQGV